MAMMMARLYTGAHDIITLRNAYHGLSGGPAPVAALVCSTAAHTCWMPAAFGVRILLM
jgi:4-aminobutyrate aminotransferase-like enzyme